MLECKVVNLFYENLEHVSATVVICYACHRGSILKELKDVGSTFFNISKLGWFWLCRVWHAIISYACNVCVLFLVDKNNLNFDISE